MSLKLTREFEIIWYRILLFDSVWFQRSIKDSFVSSYVSKLDTTDLLKHQFFSNPGFRVLIGIIISSVVRSLHRFALAEVAFQAILTWWLMFLVNFLFGFLNLQFDIEQDVQKNALFVIKHAVNF